MEQLRESFEELGFEGVSTYVQSGNVVFKEPKKASDNLPRTIEEMLLRRFSMSVSVIVRTAEEVGEVLRNNPFLKERGIDVSRLHVTFLSLTPQKTAIKGLDGIAAGPDRFHCRGQEIYLHCPNGFGGTKLSINVFEKDACGGRDHAQLEHGKQAVRDVARLAAAFKTARQNPQSHRNRPTSAPKGRSLIMH